MMAALAEFDDAYAWAPHPPAASGAGAAARVTEPSTKNGATANGASPNGAASPRGAATKIGASPNGAAPTKNGGASAASAKDAAAPPDGRRDGAAESRRETKKAPGENAYAALPAAKLQEQFIRDVRLLTVDLEARQPDVTAAAARRRIMLVLDANPEFVIGAVGGMLQKYTEPIFAGDGDFFAHRAFDDDLPRTDGDKKDLIKALIPKLQAVWAHLDDRERLQYVEHVQRMLRVFLAYKIKTLQAAA